MSQSKVQSNQVLNQKSSQSIPNDKPEAQNDKKQNFELQNRITSNNLVQNIDKPKSMNIFNENNQQRQSVNIFNKKPQNNQKNNIFSNTQKSVNLFNITSVPQTTSNNIFKSNSKPLVRNTDEDEQKTSSNASSSCLKNQQSNFKTKPEKLEMKYNYQNKWDSLKQFNLKKFKNGVNSSKEYIYLTFEKHIDDPQKIYIFVRSRQTKLIVFQGICMKNITNKVQQFMKKQENLKLTVLKQVKGSEQNQKGFIRKEELKLQFENVDDANEFKKFVDEIMREKPIQKNQEIQI